MRTCHIEFRRRLDRPSDPWVWWISRLPYSTRGVQAITDEQAETMTPTPQSDIHVMNGSKPRGGSLHTEAGSLCLARAESLGSMLPHDLQPSAMSAWHDSARQDNTSALAPGMLAPHASQVCPKETLHSIGAWHHGACSAHGQASRTVVARRGSVCRLRGIPWHRSSRHVAH